MQFREIKDTLKRIEDQVTKTNGRVTFLEKFMWTTLGMASIFALLNAKEIASLFVE